MTKQCLIIGSGPSKKLVKDIEFNGEIICCHLPHHKDTVACCSIDLTSFCTQGKLAIDNDIKFIINLSKDDYKKYKGHFSIRRRLSLLRSRESYMKSNCEELRQEKYYSKFIFAPSDLHPSCGTAMFTIEWAINQGYNFIYTAGIDFKTKTGRVLKNLNYNAINKITKEWKKKGVNIYKASEKSLLPVPIKFPQ